MVPAMEDSKESHPNRYLLDPMYKSSLVIRSNDLTMPKNKYYNVDLESQKEIDGEKEGGPLLPPTKKARRKRACTLCWCYTFYVTVIILLALGIVVLKLVPKNPRLSLGNLELNQFVYNETARRISAGVSFGLNITNRNRHSEADYYEMDFGLYFQDQSLGNFSQPGFVQKRRKTTDLKFDLPETTTTVQGQQNVAALKTQVAASNVQLVVSGSVKGKHKIFGVKVKTFNIAVMCRSNVRPDSGGVGAQELQHSCYFDA